MTNSLTSLLGVYVPHIFLLEIDISIYDLLNLQAHELDIIVHVLPRNNIKSPLIYFININMRN